MIYYIDVDIMIYLLTKTQFYYMYVHVYIYIHIIVLYNGNISTRIIIKSIRDGPPSYKLVYKPF
jgi:hypothetical protein